jgi:hypothetical protein
MRSDSDLHETRTNAEQSETGDDIRVSFVSGEWADLEGPSSRVVRLPYHEHQLQPNDGYKGILECLDIEEARVLCAAMLERFHIHDCRGFPLPPSGLPGFRRDGYEEDSPAAQLIEIGVRYAMLIIRSEPRAMHLRWQEAQELVSDIERKAKDAAQIEEVERAMREYDRRDAQPQFVYFIGAASGAIKIGTATNPQVRLKTLQTGHHERLEILATCEGGQTVEREYHARFADRRMNGEWFERCPEIETEIATLSRNPPGEQ